MERSNASLVWLDEWHVTVNSRADLDDDAAHALVAHIDTALRAWATAISEASGIEVTISQ